MDYLEEQRGELEALQSIYEGDIQVVSEEDPIAFTIPIRSDISSGNEPVHDDDEEGEDDSVVIKFTYTSKYPDELPLMEVEESRIEEDIEDDLLLHLKSTGEENLGMVMIFTLVSAGIEWLAAKLEEERLKKEEEQQRAKEEAEAEERKKLEGTRVTIESFLNWKRNFDAEREAKMAKSVKEKAMLLGNKLTGKQLFLKDNTLNESDIKFQESAGENVEVDESLFEDLDDLDLDDDDDEDWKPGDDDDDD